MILAVSDWHLGYKRCNLDAIVDFLDHYQNTEVDHFILLGDIYDFWRRNNADLIKENDEIMAKLNDLKAKNIYYVAGNHDYYILDLNKKYNHEYEGIISKYLRLEDGGESFFFIHGYEMEAILWEFPASLQMYEQFSKEMCYNKDETGGFLSKIWDINQYFGKKRRFVNDMNKLPHKREIEKVDEFALTTGKYALLGMKPHETLIFGHTHRPFINEAKKVANTGSWIDELPKNEQNSYIEIDEGKMELKYFKH
jgi:UDP-2,3-diacylglucosamine pyrophosphatase LpxH